MTQRDLTLVLMTDGELDDHLDTCRFRLRVANEEGEGALVALWAMQLSRAIAERETRLIEDRLP